MMTVSNRPDVTGVALLTVASKFGNALSYLFRKGGRGGGLKSRYRDPIIRSFSSPNSLLESKRVLTADLVQVTSLFPVRKVRVLGAVLEKTPVQRKTAGHDGFITDFR